MGFFSWECRECSHPLLSIWAASRLNGWMMDAVVIQADGGILKGTYDGYGCIGEQRIKYGPFVDGIATNEPGCYHRACWELAGSPTDYVPSKSAEDQGFFFGDAHDVPEPKEHKHEPKEAEA